MSPPPLSGRGHPRPKDPGGGGDLKLRAVVSGLTLEDIRADPDGPRDEVPDYVECAVTQRDPPTGRLRRALLREAPRGTAPLAVNSNNLATRGRKVFTLRFRE